MQIKNIETKLPLSQKQQQKKKVTYQVTEIHQKVSG